MSDDDTIKLTAEELPPEVREDLEFRIGRRLQPGENVTASISDVIGAEPPKLALVPNPTPKPKPFPILLNYKDRHELARVFGGKMPASVPWEMLAPHEAQALANHDQSLELLASRGGLDPTEMLAVLEDRAWTNMPIDRAVVRIVQLVAAHVLADLFGKHRTTIPIKCECGALFKRWIDEPIDCPKCGKKHEPANDKQHLPNPRRIPGNCIACGEPHSVVHMQWFLDKCVALGEDPVALAFENTKTPGIACMACFARRIADELEDGNPIAKRFVTACRADNAGLSVVKGGKP